MLRESAAATNARVDFRAIVDPAIAPGLEGGSELLALVEGVVAGPAGAVAAAAGAVRQRLGWQALVDAAAVIGNFEMMNRIADATGMPVGAGTLARTAEWRRELGLDRYHRDHPS